MYSPKISERHVKKLWKLKTLKKALTGERKPMTKMVYEAVEKYLDKENKRVNLLLHDKNKSATFLQMMDERGQIPKSSGVIYIDRILR